jgi:hypothetical protein
MTKEEHRRRLIRFAAGIAFVGGAALLGVGGLGLVFSELPLDGDNPVGVLLLILARVAAGGLGLAAMVLGSLFSVVGVVGLAFTHAPIVLEDDAG